MLHPHAPVISEAVTTPYPHRPVLLEEVCRLAVPETARVLVDGTIGNGGHTEALLAKNPQLEHIIGIDRDRAILDIAQERLSLPKVHLFHGKASQMQDFLEALNLTGTDAVLLDLGVSSLQLDQPNRGFAFAHDGPLDMRMDTSGGLTARDLVNSLAEEELADIFWNFGEERFSRRIARTIVQKRAGQSIETTTQLAGLVAGLVPTRRESHRHPATRVFQALRIAVNGELEELDKALPAAFSCLRPGGRLTVISFHSLEDRRVKQFFVRLAKGCICPPKFPVCTCGRKPSADILTRRPVEAGEAEIRENPRARSARLRTIQKRETCEETPT